MSSRLSTRAVAAGAAAATAGLVLGFVLVSMSAADPGAAADVASMDQVRTSEGASMDQVPSGDPSAAAVPTTPDEPAVASDPTTGGALDACLLAAAQGDAAVKAATTALGNWKTHYGAQIAFDEGAIDGDEAKRRWTKSKEPAETNVAAFVAARRAMPDDDPCAATAAGDLTDGQQRRARQCAARIAAAGDVTAAARPTMQDWRGHLKMMATREQYPIDEYLEIWRQTVADAPGPMRSFDAAVDDYRDVDGCDTDEAASAAQGVVASMVATTRPAVSVCVLGRRRATVVRT